MVVIVVYSFFNVVFGMKGEIFKGDMVRWDVLVSGKSTVDVCVLNFNVLLMPFKLCTICDLPVVYVCLYGSL